MLSSHTNWKLNKLWYFCWSHAVPIPPLAREALPAPAKAKVGLTMSFSQSTFSGTVFSFFSLPLVVGGHGVSQVLLNPML